MDLTTMLSAVGVAYGLLFFFDALFRSCMRYPYLALLEGTGLKLGFLRVSWSTTAFNRTVCGWGARWPRALRVWFGVGAWATLALLPVAVAIVLKSGADYLLPADGDRVTRGPVLESALPGVNLPLEDLGFYLFSIVLSSAWHELGHALAAAREDVPLLGFGFHVALVVPVAFCVMSAERLNALAPWRRLRVYSAGVWHNAALALFAYLLLLAMPLLFGFAYRIDEGVQVVGITAASPLSGPRGLQLGDTITSVNECAVRDKLDWDECLVDALTQRRGVCASAEFVREHDESVPTRHDDGALECCERAAHANPERLCFEHVEAAHGGAAELPQHTCLPVRRALESRFERCDSGTRYACPAGAHCVRPILPNSTHLVAIERERKPLVVYIGHPFDVHRTVAVTRYRPKSALPPSVPEAYEKATKYVIMFSIGLAVVNAFPCFVFDGQHVMQTFLHVALRSRMKRSSLRNFSFCITLVGTIVLVVVFGAMLFRQLSA